MPKEIVSPSWIRSGANPVAPYPRTNRIAGPDDGSSELSSLYESDSEYAKSNEGGNGYSIAASAFVPHSLKDSGDEPHIPRPRNSFMLFRQDMCRRQAPEVNKKGIKASEKSQIIGKIWKAMSKKDKAVWVERAVEEDKEHKKKYPGYVYKPSPRGSKGHKRKYRKTSANQQVEGFAPFSAPRASASTGSSATTSEPITDDSYFHLGTDTLQTDWFNNTTLSSYRAEPQGQSGQITYGSHVHAPLYLPQQAPAPTQVTQAVPLNAFPSVPLYARTDAHWRAIDGLIVPTDSALFFNVPETGDAESWNSFAQWPGMEHGDILGYYPSQDIPPQYTGEQAAEASSLY